ncbi:tripartite tricarboxylate transporter permease [Lysinibacillus yapensis]|uniref:Tripartite tricarboxylate transporter permease n=1 Tax=Ureibacillus yapensis TaxID=2304605 RepID=A0A396S5W1_9BACL|nr:tripartite tricarboxylate transporter permease [Lysinibacillus yapensis]RHW35900.1 tripartite tricarboxylate transporter permease [Lysinibacillus yapensis]
MADFFTNMITGFSASLTFTNVLLLFAGAFIGMIIGIIPGFGPSAAIAILLPITLSFDPTGAIIMLAGIYYGSQYGGATTSILINTPGDSAAVVTTFDGYPMAKQGQAGKALITQAIASFVGGTIGVVLIFALAPMFAKLAMKFGPPEYFLLMLLGLLTLIWMTDDSKLKGFISALIGLAIATVGVDVITGNQRYTFGSPELISGISFITVTIGLFGIGELLYQVYAGAHGDAEVNKNVDLSLRNKKNWPSWVELMANKFAFLRGSIVGFLVGVLPGAGATVASFFSYSIEKKVSKTPEKFGTGYMPGLISPEAANNSATSGAMVPLLTLGIPGSASTAILLGAFLMYGLQPGPLLMTTNPEMTWGIVSSMYLGNIILLAINIIAIPFFLYIVKVPYKLIIPIIVVLCLVGTYSLNHSILDVWLLIIFGIIGFFMKLYGYSPAALVLALVLGPTAENTLRQSLIMSEQGLGIFVARPVSLIFLLIILIIITAPYISKLTKRKKQPVMEESSNIEY